MLLRLRFWGLPVLLLAMISCRSGEFLTIGSGPLGGAYYMVGVGLADLIKDALPDLKVRVIVTGGALENPALVENGEVQVGFVNSHVAHLAIGGQPPFDSPAKNISALFTGLAPGVAHYVVRADSPIRSIRDLQGARVAAGAQGSTGAMVLSDTLEFHGMSLADLRLSYISFSEGIRALLDGKLDMAVVQSAAPSPAIMEAIAGGHDIRLIGWDLKEREAFLAKYPYYSDFHLEAAFYKGYFDPGLPLIATANMLIVDSRLEEELVYQITRTVFDQLQKFHAIHPSARWLAPEKALKTPVPLHPGAARYFQEAGFLE